MIISRTPFRVSFVGGGSDLPAFCDHRAGAVLSVTIDKAMYLTLHSYFDRHRTLLRYSRSELVERLDEIRHPIFREALRLVGVEGGVEISSSADVPSGTGLGSSSSFTVGLLHVLAAYQGRYASSEYLARTASELEIDILAEPIGRQDQYAAAFGGLNLIEFQPQGRVRVRPVTVARELLARLEERLLLFYLGGRRDTRTVLADQSEGLARDADKVAATERMVELVYEMRDALYAGELDAFGGLLHRNWELKRGLSPQISSSKIDRSYGLARDAGAIGGKLLGAGGGGFLLLFCEPGRQGAVRAALRHLDELPFSFDYAGSRIVFTDGSDRASASFLTTERGDGPAAG